MASARAFALDETHGVKWPAVVEFADSVDGDNARMLQPAGDLRFADKPFPTGVAGREVRQDLFERDFTMELFVEATETWPRPPRACSRRIHSRVDV